MRETEQPIPAEIRGYQNCPLALCVFQLTAKGYPLILVSEGMCRLLGHSRSEMFEERRRDSAAFVHPGDVRKLDLARAYARLHPDEAPSVVCRLRKSGGKYFWAACSGTARRIGAADYLFVQYVDVSDHEALHETAQREKQRSESLLDKILSTTQTAIFWKDADRRFLGANRAFLDYYGFAGQREIVGRNDEEMGWHREPGPYKDDELRVLEDGISTYRVHGKCLARGEERDIVASKTPLYIDGKIAGLVGSFEDVTVECRQKDQIERLNRELEDKLAAEAELKRQAEAANAAKTDFLSRMSHDIRTPLNGIIGMSYLTQEMELPEAARENLRKIDTSSRFLLSLINDVLDMSKAESGKIELHPEPYDPEAFFSYLNSVIQPLCAEKGLHFVVDVQPLSGVRPLLDTLRINQIFFNLLSNAVKFTPEGGTVTYRLREQLTPEGRLAMTGEVSDTGIGMSADFQTHLFEPFVQEQCSERAEGRGTGLGLAIVKKLLDLMGCRISVSSEPGKGTAFRIAGEFACVPSGAEAPGRKEGGTAAPASLAGRHVLLCEDHPLNQEIAMQLLAEQGMIVTLAEDGRQGVKAFAGSAPGYYAVVLMDVRMPVLDGLAAARQIRQLKRPDALAVPIIAMTADAFAEDIRKCYEAGMTGHITKPIEPAKLIGQLARLIGGVPDKDGGKNGR